MGHPPPTVDSSDGVCPPSVIAGFFMFGIVVDVRTLKQAGLGLASVAAPFVTFLVSLGAEVIEASNSTLP